jgi:hypothetical protein
MFREATYFLSLVILRKKRGKYLFSIVYLHRAESWMNDFWKFLEAQTVF